MTANRITRTSIAAALLASSIAAAEVTAAATLDVDIAPRPWAQPAAQALRSMLRPEVVKSIAAWGVMPDEVVEDVGRLGEAEIARLVVEARRLAGRDWRRSARDQAMYLVLVAQMRESLLFARVVFRMRSAGAERVTPAAPGACAAGEGEGLPGCAGAAAYR